VRKGTLAGYPGIVEFPLYNIATSPDGNFILIPTYFGALSLKDILTGEEVRVYRAQIGYWWEATFSADGKLIASAYDDGSVLLIDTASGEVLHILEHPQSTLVGLSFSPDDRLLVTVSLDATLRLWDTTTGAQKLVLENITETRPDGVTFRPDGRVIAVSNQEGISLFFKDLEDLIKLAQDRTSRGFTIQECLTYAINNCSMEKAFSPPIQAEFNSSEIKENERWLVCHLLDYGGINASIFNQLPHQGMLQAAQEFGWDTRTVEPLLMSDIREGMRSFLESGCDLIILSTFDEVTIAMPDDHLDQRYVFVTTTYESVEWENVWSAVYAEDQPSFLAGYLAAAMTRSGKVGLFGGAPIPAVLKFMDGFALGVGYYNQQYHSQVELVGWSAGGDTSQGIFINFGDPESGYATTEELIARGVDIIFPVAGQWNMAAASEAALTHEGVYVIGVDEDWAANYPQYASITITSVMKHLDKPVYWAMEAITHATFRGGLHLGTLENGGVGLAPFYKFEALIPEQVKQELEDIKQDIIAGKIRTK
jgi:basic membrane protein A and related proteins